MRYFVLTKQLTGRDGFSLCKFPPPSKTKEERRRARYIYLSEAGAALSLSQLISLQAAGELEGSKVWTAPDPAFAQKRQAPPTLNPLARQFRRASVPVAAVEPTEGKDNP